MKHAFLILVLAAAAGAASAQPMQTQGAGDMNTNTQMDPGTRNNGSAKPSSGAGGTASTGASLAADSADASPLSSPAGIAQRQIELAGYRNVTGLAKGADGLWHGNAMRGNSSVQVTVDRAGKVLAH